MSRAQPDPQTKRYLSCNRFVVDLPRHFINSPNRKYVEIVAVHLFINEGKIDDKIETFQIPSFFSFHGDFVQDNRELDHYVQMANSLMSQRKKYQILSVPSKIEIWFTDLFGGRIDKDNTELRADGFYYQEMQPDDGGEVEYRKIKFIVELLLMY